METAPQATQTSKTTPRDFFFWLGAIVALYVSVTSFIALTFEYVNYAFPDALAGSGDPYGGSMRFSMAALMVLVPTVIVLFRLIRGTIERDPGKAHIWVRRWAIVLTLFIAAVTIIIDLITLINTFLGGEITMRFGIKVAIVLLIALGVFLHFLADQKGFWMLHPKKANMVGIAVAILSLVTVISGFFIVGSPSHVRMLRYDDQKVSDLQVIQSQVVSYWQMKGELPKNLSQTTDSLSGFTIPADPQTGSAYRYEVTGNLSFKLCATFNAPTSDTRGQGAYYDKGVAYLSVAGGEENWYHNTGEVCYMRTIGPKRYPPADAATTSAVKPL